MMIVNKLKQYSKTAQNSFKLAWKGEETLNNLIFFWGGIAYVTTFLITAKIQNALNQTNPIIDILAYLSVIYFIIHIILVRKCTPKKPKLSKEEKKLKKEKAKQERQNLKNAWQKLTLQKPLFKWNPPLIIIALDLYCITDQLSKI